MPQKIDPNLDPVIVAAMIDDDDDEEGKAITAAALKAAGTDSNNADDLDNDDDINDDDNHNDDDKKDPADDPDKKDDKQDDSDKKDDKFVPPEARDAGDDDPDKDDKNGLTRQEKRAQRRAEWQAKIANKPAATNQFQNDPNYKPLEYKEGDSLDPGDLAKDREAFAKHVANRTAAEVQHTNEQIKFWESVDYQSKILLANPRYAFLDENNKEAYNEKRADAINRGYFTLIGYKETPITDNKGNPLLDRTTNKPQLNITVERNDIGYDEYVKQWLDDMEDFADDLNDDVSANRNAQRRNQGIRPGGGGRRSRSKVNGVGDISKLSDEEFEELDKSGELDAAIARQAGW